MAADPITPAPTLTSILSGDVTWYNDPTQPGVWYAAYMMPGSHLRMVFEASREQMDAIFGTGKRPPVQGTLSLQQISQRPLFIYSGNIGEMAGEGDFNDEVDRVIAVATDEGYMPEWLENNQKAWDLLYISILENKGNDWLLEQWAKLPAFRQHYPKLDVLMDTGLELPQAVEAYNLFDQEVRQLWLSMGKDPAAIRRGAIGGLLAQGHSITSVSDAVSTWRRMQRYAPSFAAFNSILQAKGMDPLKPGQMMSFLRGTAPAEMYDIYESSSFAEAANAAGLGQYFSASEAIQVAMQTPGISDLATISQGMQAAAATILRLRSELNIGKFGLDFDDLIDVSLGIAPRSGHTEADIRENVDRVMLEAQAWMENRAQPYRAYSSQGVPGSASLQGMRPKS